MTEKDDLMSDWEKVLAVAVKEIAELRLRELEKSIEFLRGLNRRNEAARKRVP